MTLTVDDRELIERAVNWPATDQGDALSAEFVGTLLKELSDRLQSLLSDRDKLRDALDEIGLRSCNHSGWVENDAWKGVCEIHEIATAALTQTEVP